MLLAVRLWAWGLSRLAAKCPLFPQITTSKTRPSRNASRTRWAARAPPFLPLAATSLILMGHIHYASDLRQRHESRKQQNMRTRRQIASKRKELSELLVEEATESQRCDELHSKLIAMRTTIELETDSFSQQWKSKTRKLANDRARVHSRFQAKREKELLDESSRREKSRVVAANEALSLGNVSSGGVSFHARENIERVKTLEQAFERMMENTDFETIDQLVMLFLDTEQRNFSLFNVRTKTARRDTQPGCVIEFPVRLLMCATRLLSNVVLSRLCARTPIQIVPRPPPSLFSFLLLFSTDDQRAQS